MYLPSTIWSRSPGAAVAVAATVSDVSTHAY